MCISFVGNITWRYIKLNIVLGLLTQRWPDDHIDRHIGIPLIDIKGITSLINGGIRQYDSSDTGHSDNVNIAAEHQEPAEVLSQLDNTSNSPVYGEYKCC